MDNVIQYNRFYSIGEICLITGEHYDYIHYHIKQRNLKAHKPKGSRRWRVRGKVFLEWYGVTISTRATEYGFGVIGVSSQIAD